MFIEVITVDKEPLLIPVKDIKAVYPDGDGSFIETLRGTKKAYGYSVLDDYEIIKKKLLFEEC